MSRTLEDIAATVTAEVLTPRVLGRAPAVHVAVSDPGGIRHVTTHGAAAADTVFRIASMSKSFLAATVMALRDEGVLDLHAPLSRHLPGARLRWRGGTADVTLDALLSNRSGLPEDNAWADRHLDLTREELHALAAGGLELAAPPDLEYQYSNLGMALVALAVLEETGTSVQDLVRERFLRPLGLTATGFSVQEVTAAGVTDVAGMYRTFDDGATFVDEPYLGDGMLGSTGGMFSSAADVAAWMRFLASALTGAPVLPEVLAPASRRDLQRIRTAIPVGADRSDRLDAFGYGYGLMVEHDRRFGRIVQHSGGLPGVSTHMRWHAASGLGVTVFGSADGFAAGVHAQRIMTGILTRLEDGTGAGTDTVTTAVRPWPGALAAAARVDEALSAAARAAVTDDPARPRVDPDTFTALAPVLADNVLPDTPAPVLAERVGTVLRRTGGPRDELAGLDARLLPSTNAATVRWWIPCTRGELVCEAGAVVIGEPRLERLSFRAAADDERGIART